MSVYNFPDIYARSLRHLKFGIPLWYPEPQDHGETQIGDVGFLQLGCFYRLFNVLNPDMDRSQPDIPRLVVPPDRVVRSILAPGILSSRGVSCLSNPPSNPIVTQSLPSVSSHDASASSANLAVGG